MGEHGLDYTDNRQTPFRTVSGSLKRARPMSPTLTSVVADTSYHPVTTNVLSPFAPVEPASAVWSHITAAHMAVSPPPMANMEYELHDGLDTPSMLAAREYESMEKSDYMGDRWRRGIPAMNIRYDDTVILGGEKNGRGRLTGDGQDMNAPTAEQQKSAGWGGYVLGAIGTVVAGTWAFCRKTAFSGFYAGEGPGYDIAHGNQFTSESLWEDECDETQQNLTTPHRTFSFERLPTPTPGEYPGDSPPPEEELQRIEYDQRSSKRRQTDGGGWIVIDDNSQTPTRVCSPPQHLLVTPSAVARPHVRAQSVSASLRSLSSVSRHRRRISANAVSSSPATTPISKPSSRRSSYLRPLSPNPGVSAVPTSPMSVEARKYVSRRRKEERDADERYDRLNDRLKEMIKQGKEALGTKVEIVADEEIW